MQTFIRLFKGLGENLEAERESYTPADFGGTIPVIGDIIVDPSVRPAADRADPAEHTLYEVTRRYFVPTAGLPLLVNLVVRPRAAGFEERDVIGD